MMQVHPVFMHNSEEMKWNPLFDCWTFFGLDVAYGKMLRMMPEPLEWLLWQVCIKLSSVESLLQPPWKTFPFLHCPLECLLWLACYIVCVPAKFSLPVSGMPILTHCWQGLRSSFFADAQLFASERKISSASSRDSDLLACRADRSLFCMAGVLHLVTLGKITSAGSGRAHFVVLS